MNEKREIKKKRKKKWKGGGGGKKEEIKNMKNMYICFKRTKPNLFINTTLGNSDEIGTSTLSPQQWLFDGNPQAEVTKGARKKDEPFVSSTALTPFGGLVHQPAFAEERASKLRFLIYLHYNIGFAAGLVNYFTANIYSVLHKAFSYKFNLHRMLYKNILKVSISYRTYFLFHRSLTLYECIKIDRTLSKFL